MIDPETTLDTVGKASEAVTKFQEIMLKVFGPRWTIKQADADAYADQRKLQTIRDNPDMEIIYTQDGMIAKAKNLEELAYRAEQRMLNDAIRQEHNIEKVLEIAAYEIEQVTEVDDKQVDDDWVTRFFNIAKDIGTEEMQHIWGKILSDEVAHPGNFSLRTLDTIRNVSKAEAELFQKVSSCVLCSNNDGLIPQNLSLLEKQGVSYNDLILLSEAGLLNLSSITYALDFKANTRFWINFISKKFLLRITGDSAKAFRFSYGVYKLTSAGSELYSIIDSVPSEEYMFAVASDIGKHFYNNGDIAVHRIISCENKEISYEENPVFEQKRLIKA